MVYTHNTGSLATCKLLRPSAYLCPRVSGRSLRSLGPHMTNNAPVVKQRQQNCGRCVENSSGEQVPGPADWKTQRAWTVEILLVPWRRTFHDSVTLEAGAVSMHDKSPVQW